MHKIICGFRTTFARMSTLYPLLINHMQQQQLLQEAGDEGETEGQGLKG